MSLLEYCTTERQRQIIELHEDGLGYTRIGEKLNINRCTARDVVKLIKTRAALAGLAPDHDMVHTVPDGFHVKGVSTYYKDGQAVGQWVKSESDKDIALRTALETFKEGLTEQFDSLAKPVAKPGEVLTNENRLAAYMIGDHHLGALADPLMTNDEPWNLEHAQAILMKAVDKLISASTDAKVGALVNLGDFMHVNGLNKMTGGMTPQDTDGSPARAIRVVGNLFQHLIQRMLRVHDEVWIINVRGNHDPDAALWLNEMLRMYYSNEPRIKVFDNFSKWIHFEWGKNLVVFHHGDKVKTQALYEAVTRDYSEEWGRTKHRYLFHGHIHHRTCTELGGMFIESMAVLCSVDNWHKGMGYGAARSMSCIVFDKEHGEHSRYKVGIDALQ